MRRCRAAAAQWVLTRVETAGRASQNPQPPQIGCAPGAASRGRLYSTANVGS